MHLFATSTAQEFLDLGKVAAVLECEPEKPDATRSAG